MKKHSEGAPDWQDQRKKIIGLGESSLRKSYYPELKEKIAELEKKNEELHTSYEQLTASEEELRQNYEELSRREQELKESEEKFRNLIENTFDGVVIHKDGIMVYANQTAARLLGYTDPANLIGISILDVTHPDYRDIVKERASGALSEVQFPLRELFNRADGTAISVDVVATPAIWEGKPAVQVAFRDITAQMRAEDALQESEIRFKDLFNNMSAGVAIYKPIQDNENFIIQDVNRAVERIEQVNKNEIIGKSVLEIFPGVREYGLFEVFQRVARTGIAESYPISIYHDKRISGWRENYVYRLPSGEVVAIYDDVTEKKQAEELQRESEQRYRALVETTDTGFVIVDIQGRVVDANQKYIELSGHGALQEILGRNVLEWTADYEREKNARAVEQCAATGIIRNLEIDYIGPSGTITPIEINATVVSFGNTRRILTLCRDITERRKVEKTLRESETFYRTVFNTTGSATVIIEKDTTIIRSNEGFARLSGYTVEELEGKHRWTEFIGTKDLGRMKAYHDARRIDPASVPGTYEFGFIDRKGAIRHCISYVAMIPGTSRSVASLVDITDRVIAENELRSAKTHLEAIYEGSPDLIFVHGSDGHIIDVNENVLRAYGVSREEMLSSSPSDRSGKGYTTEMAMANFRVAQENGQASFNWVCRRENGEEFPAEIRLRRIESVNDRGEIEPRILAIVRDITERQMAEKALEQARKKLSLLNTVIFQDIQSTVFALSAYIQLAGSSRDETKMQAYSAKETFLINKVVASLNFTRNYQDLGLHPPRWQSVGQVFLYAISHLDSLKISRQMHVEGIEIYADPLLEKVFFNLVENSYIHGQRVTEIFLTYTETDQGILITLADNGVGIPAEEKKRLFERGSGKNQGLGLFLVREILSITGISIQETGETGMGARFEILVPKGAYRIIGQK